MSFVYFYYFVLIIIKYFFKNHPKLSFNIFKFNSESRKLEIIFKHESSNKLKSLFMFIFYWLNKYKFIYLKSTAND